MMNEQQKEFFRQVIRPVLIRMAVDATLPMDMNEICWAHFEDEAEEFNKENASKVIVKIGGGCVREVIHNIEDLEIEVIDADIEDTESDEIVIFEDEEYYGYMGEVGNYSPERIKKFEEYVPFKDRQFLVMISEEGETPSKVITGERLLEEDQNKNEYEFIYALQDIIEDIKKLETKESEYFQPNRDNKRSKGIITRI